MEVTKRIRVKVIANGQAILINQVVELDVPIPVDQLVEPATTITTLIEPEPDVVGKDM